MPSCDICFESRRKHLTCPYCNTSCCMKCWSTYFLSLANEKSTPALCINLKCSKSMPKQFLNRLPRNFHKEYDSCMGRLVYNQDLASFATLIPLIEQKKELNKLDEEISLLSRDRQDLEHRLNRLFRKHMSDKKYSDLYDVMETILSFSISRPTFTKQSKASLQDTFFDIFKSSENKDGALMERVADQYLENFYPKFTKIERRNFINLNRDIMNHIISIEKMVQNRKNVCAIYNRLEYEILNKPLPEDATTITCFKPNCKGILNEDGVCITCDHFNCRKCSTLSLKSEDHTCKEEDILTTNSLEKDSQRCPECKEVITKIVACDVMFCTLCNTSFNYKTGKKITSGSRHNPHYLEWLEKNGMAYSANETIENNETLLSPIRIKSLLKKHKVAHSKHLIDSVYRLIYEMRDGEDLEYNMSFFTEEIRAAHFAKYNVYIEYLAGSLTEEQMIYKVSNILKKKIINIEMREMMQSFTDTLAYTYADLYINRDYSLFVERISSLCKETNQNISRLSYIHCKKLFRFKIDPIKGYPSESLLIIYYQ